MLWRCMIDGYSKLAACLIFRAFAFGGIWSVFFDMAMLDFMHPYSRFYLNNQKFCLFMLDQGVANKKISLFCEIFMSTHLSCSYCCVLWCTDLTRSSIRKSLQMWFMRMIRYCLTCFMLVITEIGCYIAVSFGNL